MQLDKSTLKKIGIPIAVIVVILLILPMLINVDSFRPKIETELTKALGRPVTMGQLSLSLLSGSVKIDKIGIGDDPAFSKEPFLTAKSLKVGVKLLPLIFSKELNVTGIELEEPEITLLKAGNGKWNFSTLGSGEKKPAETAGKEKGEVPNLSIGKLEVTNGKLSVGKVGSSAKPQVYEKLEAEMEDFSATSQFPFKLSVKMPGGGEVNLSGKAGPINKTDSAKTPFDATIKVKNFDIAKSGFVDASAGLGGEANFEGTVNSNGQQGKATGAVSVEKLKLSPKGSPAPELVKVKYAIDLDMDKESGTITQGDIALGKAMAKLTGGFQSQGESTVLNMKLNAPDMPVNELEAFLPAMGVTLPSGSKLKGGTLSADLSITGTVEQTIISGPVRLANTKLDGFDMGGKLGALPGIGGKTKSSGDTTIQNASLTANVAPEMTRADGINVTISSLGTVTGAGTISPSGALNFKMMADLETNRSDARADRRGGTGGPIPFMIQGTTSNPSFVPDVGGMAGTAAKGAISGAVKGTTGGASSGLGGVFGRKKK
jgi:AsmA protein